MNNPPVLMFARFLLTRPGPLLALVSSYSTVAVMGARSNRRRSSCAEVLIAIPIPLVSFVSLSFFDCRSRREGREPGRASAGELKPGQSPSNSYIGQSSLTRPLCFGVENAV